MSSDTAKEDTLSGKRRYLNGKKLQEVLELRGVDISQKNSRYDLPSPSELNRMIKLNEGSIGMIRKVLRAFIIPPSAIDADLQLNDCAISLMYRDGLHSELIGQWIIHHRVATALDSNLLAVGQLVIKSDGACSLVYLTDSRLSFIGTVIPEANGRFIVSLDCTGDINHIERRVFRGEVPFDGEFSSLEAVWLGVGRARRGVCGKVILVKTNEELTKELRQKLDAHAYEAITSAESSWLDDSSDKEADGMAETIHASWVGDKIFSALAASLPGETHYLLSSCYPGSEFSRLLVELKRLRDNKAKRFKPNDLPVKIVILLLKTNSLAISEERFNHYPNPDDAIGTEFRKVIYNQACKLLEVAAVRPSYVDIELRMYDGWVFGHYFKFGNRKTFFSPLLATESAVSSLMITSSHPDSRIWGKLLDSWDATIKKAPRISSLAELKELSGSFD